MNEITRLGLYLNELQYAKLCEVAAISGKTPEEVANNVIYGYLAIVDPYAEDEEEE